MSFIPRRFQRLLPILLALIAAMIPGAAFAAGSEANVVLEFKGTDQIYLIVSFVLGLVAIIAGIILKKQVLSQSPGDEKMQEVGSAIRQGALAYLKQQIRTMLMFVFPLAVLLAIMYGKQYGNMVTGILTAVSFIAGVGASYYAGFVGMDMAVLGNMRTANAALTSYRKSLEIAFRSGAVAGMYTVGMGLIGATVIFFVGQADAMKYLIGFGFGGSLAALFMRVGGGIFTKAADVGADLVGKVEAGIPEDDPRNPATIADNVGDNVGDCAGMAADVFESYEVTLVAAIVLGAATASIFDQSTWMKLILFALMARGVGIAASIFGVFSVKGSDDINSDPLKSIRKGFYVSAGIAALGTLVVAMLMMGGTSKDGLIQARLLSDRNSVILKISNDIDEARRQAAASKKVDIKEIKASDILDHPLVTKWQLPEAQKSNIVSGVLSASDEDKAALSRDSMAGFKQVELTDPALSKFLVGKPDRQTGKMTYVSLKEAWESKPIQDKVDPDTKKPYISGPRVYKVLQENGPNPQPQIDGTLPKPRTLYLIHSDKEALVNDLKQSEAAGSLKFTVQEPKEGLPVRYYVKGDKLALGAEVSPRDFIFDTVNRITDPLYTGDAKVIEENTKKADQISNELNDIQMKMNEVSSKLQEEKDANKKKALESESLTLSKQFADKQAEQQQIELPKMVQVIEAAAIPVTVEWWKFFACITFGIAMAFAIELLTDYYVGIENKPVQEVAGVSTAGPAPMIIQGFAYGMESSVFSVVAIVVALLFPLMIFPEAVYGSYILSFYGIALVGLGLLTTTGYILAMDTFGPISDNAQGVFEMSGAGHKSPEGSRAVQKLDAAGNTTKALTKGFAIATAVVAAVALFHSFVEDTHLGELGMRLEVPEIFLGLMIGGAAPYLFSAFSINAVGRASFELINEVRRQFKNDPGIMAGTSKPNYANCVAIVTAAAQKELLGPGILAIALPVAVGFGFAIGKAPHVGAQALGGFLAGAILSGQLMAVLLANSGGMWDNAKKLIEDGNFGGKGSEAHKAGVVCDTVGDPFKDTAGPALNPLIKVMNLVALLLAPVIISTDIKDGARIAITLLCLGALSFSIWWSKRGSMSTGLAAAHSEASADNVIKIPAPSGEKRITVDDEE
jgi:K(+)-stimulated pyrophosphate-energized sodium pump